MNEDIAKLRRSIKVNRVILIIILILFLCILAGIGAVGFYAYKMSQQYIPLVRKFTEVDWTLLSDRISRLNPADLNDKIEGVLADVDSIKQSLETITMALPR